MAYADPAKRRAYDRDYKRMRRGGVCLTPGQTQIPSEFRIKTARDVLNLLAEQIQAVREDEKAGTLEKARCIGYLGGIALKAVEIADLSDRVEAMEKVLNQRKEPESCERNLWPSLTTN
jgi:hypothetical protein